MSAAYAKAPEANALPEWGAARRNESPIEQRTGSIESQRPRSSKITAASRSMIVDDDEHEFEQSLNQLVSNRNRDRSAALPSPSRPRRVRTGASPSASPVTRRPREVSQIRRMLSTDGGAVPKQASSPPKEMRCCISWMQMLVIGVPLVLGIMLSLALIFGHETRAVCQRIAMDVMRAQVREPGCVLDRHFDNLLVHMTCRLNYGGAADPGSGVRGSGYRMAVSSVMLQYDVRRHAYGEGEFCWCFERVWRPFYIDLDPDMRWSPQLCQWKNVDVGYECRADFPGVNPWFPDNGTETRSSLGEFEYFDKNVRLGEEGLRLPESLLRSVDDDLVRPAHFPLYYMNYQYMRDARKYSVEPRVLRHGLVTHGRLAYDGWYYIECPRTDYYLYEEDKYYLYKPRTAPYKERLEKLLKKQQQQQQQQQQGEGGTEADGEGVGGEEEEKELTAEERQLAERKAEAKYGWKDGSLDGEWNPCRDNTWFSGEVGDRMLMVSAYGVHAVTALGQQQIDGSIGGYVFPFSDGTCAAQAPEVFYAGRVTDVESMSIDWIFRDFQQDLYNEVCDARIKGFFGVLFCVVLFTLLMRSAHLPFSERTRAALRHLTGWGTVGLTICLTLWLWSIPMYMWVLPKPSFGLQMLGLGVVCFYTARSVLACAYEANSRTQRSISPQVPRSPDLNTLRKSWPTSAATSAAANAPASAPANAPANAPAASSVEGDASEGLLASWLRDRFIRRQHEISPQQARTNNPTGAALL